MIILRDVIVQLLQPWCRRVVLPGSGEQIKGEGVGATVGKRKRDSGLAPDCSEELHSDVDLFEGNSTDGAIFENKSGGGVGAG